MEYKLVKEAQKRLNKARLGCSYTPEELETVRLEVLYDAILALTDRLGKIEEQIADLPVDESMKRWRARMAMQDTGALRSNPSVHQPHTDYLVGGIGPAPGEDPKP